MPRQIRSYILPVIFVLLLGIVALGVSAGLTSDPAHTNGTDTEDSRSYTFDHADTRISVTPAAALHVTETLGFDFVGAFHGAFRDIPLRDGERLTNVTLADAAGAYQPGASTKLGSAGASQTFGVERHADFERVVWHYDASGPHDFRIDYDLVGAVHVHGDQAELNYQVWGDEWKAPVGQLTASITLPPGAGDLHAWVHSKYADASARVDSPIQATLHAQDVPEHHLVELHVVFPASRIGEARRADVVTDAAAIDVSAIDAREHGYATAAADRRTARADLHDRASTYGFIGWGAGIVLGALLVLVLYRAWWREDDRIDAAPAADAVPPDELEPALVASLVHQKTEVGNDALVATLLEIVRRGRFRTVPAESDKRGAQVDVALLPGTKGDVELNDVEQPVAELVDLLLEKHPDGVPMGQVEHVLKQDKELATAVYAKVVQFRAAATAQVKSARWYQARGVVVVVVLLVLAAGAAALATVLAVTEYTDFAFRGVGAAAACAIAFVGVALALVVVLCSPRLYRVYRPEAVEQAARWRGFERYLREMTDLGHEQTASLPLWERILVYGAAFGLATDVVNAVKPEVDGQAVSGSSLQGMSSLAWVSAAGLTSFASVGSSVSSVGAPKSSSSGGGGGFGGGSGGGGGGAW